jgi:hypothetical protein
MSALIVGLTPGPLTVWYVVEEPLAFSLTLKKDGVPIPWPEAPKLIFGNEVEVIAVLTGSGEPEVANAKATWSMTQPEIEVMDKLPDSGAKITVQGMSWWKGQALRHD